MNSHNTKSYYNPKLYDPKRFDYMVRLTGNISGLADIKFIETGTFRDTMKAFLTEIESERATLIEVIRSQKAMLDYEGHYIAYVLEQISDEEFKKIAEEYALEPVDISLEELCSKIEHLVFSTGLSYSSRDLASIFKSPEDKVVLALERLQSEKKIV